MVAEGAALMFWAERLCYIIMASSPSYCKSWDPGLVLIVALRVRFRLGSFILVLIN